MDLTYRGVALSDAVPEALVTSVARESLPALRPAFVDIPGRAGSIVFPEEPGDRTIRVSVHLLAESFEARRAAVRALAAWAYSPVPATLVLDDEDGYFETAILASAPTVDERLNYASAEIEFRCGAHSYAAEISEESWTALDGTDFAFVVDDPVEIEPVIFVTLDTDASWIELVVDGRTLRIEGTLDDSQTIAISSLAYVVAFGVSTLEAFDEALDGSFPAESVDMTGVSGVFPRIPLGGCDIRLESSSGTDAGIDVYWRRRAL